MKSLDLKDYLGAIPRCEDSGKPIPVPYEELLKNIASLDAACEPHKVVRELDCEGWLQIEIVETQAGRTLTAEGLRRWEKIPSTRVVPAKNSDESEWQDFRRLLDYYIDCVRVSERAQDFIRSNERGMQWFIPALDRSWADFTVKKIVDSMNDAMEGNASAHEQIREIEIPVARSDSIASARLLASKGDPVQIFLGYPVVDIWRKSGDQKVPDFSPIFMIPVEVEPTLLGKLRVRLNFSRTRVNYRWFEVATKSSFNEKDVDSRVFDEKTGFFKFDEAMLLVSTICKNNNASEHDTLDPSDLRADLHISQKGVYKVRNTAILFVSDNLTYGKNLLAELEKIKGVSAEDLDKTALAYIFRKHVKPAAQLGKYSVPVAENKTARELVFSFVPVSDAQTVATERAFIEPLSVIQGPPGTGKSQVVANIIGNSVWRGESVLFTSRNHKAIDAVRVKCEEIDKTVDLGCLAKNPAITFVDDNHTWIEGVENIYSNAQELRKYLLNGRDDPAENYEKIKSEADKITKILSESIAPVAEAEADLKIFQEEFSEKFPPVFDRLKKTVLLDECEDDSEISKILASAEKVFRFYKNAESYSAFAKFFLKLIKGIYLRERRLREKLDVKFAASPELCEKRLAEIETIQKARRKIRELRETLKTLKTEDATGKDAVELLKHFFAEEKTSGNAGENGATKSKTPAFSEDFKRAFAYSRCLALEKFPQKEFDNISECAKVLGRYKSEGSDEVIREQNEALALYSKFLKLMPAWARTSLSLWRAIPCVAGIVDRVIIDEAGQCDIPSCIPALFRAKQAVIVGDPKQFPPIIELSEQYHNAAKKRFSIEKELAPFDFCEFAAKKNTIYELAARKLREGSCGKRSDLLLDEHFRCGEEQAAYFNEVFYGGALRVRTASTGERGYVWHDVVGGVDAEVQKTIELLKELQAKNANWTFGIISPLKFCRDKLREAAYSAGIKVENPASDKNAKNAPATTDNSSVVISTVNGFQGGERDIIIFVLGLSVNMEKGQRWYIEDDSNKYIYNVAISRAKICAHVVGNRELAKKSQLLALRKLAEPPRPRESKFDSPPEEMLYDALKLAGIDTFPQYPLAGHFLDLAIPAKKIDIEVDGRKYHTYSDGRRKISDYQRDMNIEGAGWTVIRFWAKDVSNNIEECVEEVQKLL